VDGGTLGLDQKMRHSIRKDPARERRSGPAHRGRKTSAKAMTIGHLLELGIASPVFMRSRNCLDQVEPDDAGVERQKIFGPILIARVVISQVPGGSYREP
jgi:hypothetical protein